MNWLHFSIWVSGLYLLYYLVVILLDVAANKRAPAHAVIRRAYFFRTGATQTIAA